MYVSKFYFNKKIFKKVLGVAIVQSQYEPPTSQSSKEQSFFVGMLSVITMCISSAFAGKFKLFLCLESPHVQLHFLALFRFIKTCLTGESHFRYILGIEGWSLIMRRRLDR